MSDRIYRDAINIRKLMREAEAVTDEAMMACAKLKQAMLQARANPRVGSHQGQRAVVRLGQAEQQAIAMQNSLLRVHEELNHVAGITAGLDEGGLRTDMGDLIEETSMDPAPDKALETV